MWEERDELFPEIEDIGQIDQEYVYNMFINQNTLNNFFDLVSQEIQNCRDYCAGLTPYEQFQYSALNQKGFFVYLTGISDRCAECCEQRTG